MVKLRCCKCKEEKDSDCFYKRNNARGFRHECKECFNKNGRHKNLVKLKENKCRYCQDGRIKGSRYCLFHCVKMNCRVSNIDFSLIDPLIDKLYSQKFECHYTGKLLIPGVNTSLDHKIPKAKGGLNTLDNLIWVDISVNRLKGKTDYKVFLEKSSDLLLELNQLASLETPEQKRQKLAYVLGSSFAPNALIG